jgi:ribosome-associated translation inhibitor RaiA
MYKSIDLAVQKLERMLKKYKAHLRSFNREKAGTIAVNRIPLYEEE